MDTVNEIGIQIVLIMQNLGAWLEPPMRFFSFLGTEDFFLLILPILYWSVDSALGLRVGYILLFSQGLNHLFKIALIGPRPYWFSEKVLPLSTESSFGAPSGHAQSAAGVWGMMAAYINKPWSWLVGILIILLIGLSRIYLGVHFPHDVLLGYLLGGLSLWVFLAFWDRAAARLRMLSFGMQIGLAFVISMGLILFSYLIMLARSDYKLDEAWAPNILRASDELPEPFAVSGMVTVAGLLFGLSLGLAWMERQGGFHASGSIAMRITCYLLGLVGVLLFWYGLGAILPRGEAPLPLFMRFLRYSLVGAWVTGGAPWLFTWLKLVRSKPGNQQEMAATR